ncbi:MAG: pectinesterase family protein [Chitinophagaceae bacterium]
MKKLTTLFVLLAACFAAFAQQPTYPSYLVVAQDGSGNYKTIQEAVNAVRDLSQVQVTIFIKKGVYHEKLVVPSWKTMISLVGESKDSTVITNNDYSGKAYPGGADAYGKDKYSTYTSYTVLIQGNDCRVENLTIENTAGRVGQAVALHVEGDRSVIKNCRLLGNQDTLYAATETSRQLFQDCYIEGTTDFIFGEATVLFQHCVIKSLTNSFVTAAATTPRQEFGFVFTDCELIADTAAKKVYLGRPWRPYSKTVFIRTVMGSHILPVGWNNWNNVENEKTVLYAEYNSTGAGANTTARVKWSKQLSEKQLKRYTPENIFAGAVKWNPFSKSESPVPGK